MYIMYPLWRWVANWWLNGISVCMCRQVRVPTRGMVQTDRHRPAATSRSKRKRGVDPHRGATVPAEVHRMQTCMLA